jgi:hypothetical protein
MLVPAWLETIQFHIIIQYPKSKEEISLNPTDTDVVGNLPNN